MPTKLSKPVSRISNSELDGSYGPDRHKRIIITIIPGGSEGGDLFELRPAGTSRPEVIRVVDVYGIALRARAESERRTKKGSK
jgi:hypothetical protein